MGNRWDGTTPTDTRSRRSRTSRRGGQLLTRARSPSCKNGLPIRVPRRPLFRTVTPYARRRSPSQQNNKRASAVFHTGYECDRVLERPLPASGQSPRPLPVRAGRTEVSVFGDQITRPDRPRPGTMDDALVESARGAVAALLPVRLSTTLENEAIATVENEATQTDWVGDLGGGLGVDPAAGGGRGSAAAGRQAVGDRAGDGGPGGGVGPAAEVRARAGSRRRSRRSRRG